jgi:hypothetical protein
VSGSITHTRVNVGAFDSRQEPYALVAHVLMSFSRSRGTGRNTPGCGLLKQKARAIKVSG